MMEVTLTCSECKSAVNILPGKNVENAKCDVCDHLTPVSFDENHLNSILKICPTCSRKDFYSQKDFSRSVGVSLFVVAAILSIYTYGISFIVLYLADLLLFKKLSKIGICYNCNTIFRKVKNINQIYPYDHEMNDRIVYSGHDFEGRPPVSH